MSNEELIIGLAKKLIQQDALIEYYEAQLKSKESITGFNDETPLKEEK